MFCCCYNKNINKNIKKQKKDEYNNKKIHISILGNYIPMPVYFGNKHIFTNEDILVGLNSLCINEIHISIGFNPNRLILSHIRNIEDNKYKDECFYIMTFDNKEVNNVVNVTQYDIYNAIQEYVLLNKKQPKFEIKELPLLAI